MSEWKPIVGLLNERTSRRILRVWYLAGALAGGWMGGCLATDDKWLFILALAASGMMIAAIAAAVIDTAVDFGCDRPLFNDVFASYPKSKAEEDLRRELYYLDLHI